MPAAAIRRPLARALSSAAARSSRSAASASCGVAQTPVASSTIEASSSIFSTPGSSRPSRPRQHASTPASAPASRRRGSAPPPRSRATRARSRRNAARSRAVRQPRAGHCLRANSVNEKTSASAATAHHGVEPPASRAAGPVGERRQWQPRRSEARAVRRRSTVREGSDLASHGERRDRREQLRRRRRHGSQCLLTGLRDRRGPLGSRREDSDRDLAHLERRPARITTTLIV